MAKAERESNHDNKPRPRSSSSIGSNQGDLSIMAKLLKIAETKDVTPDQAAAFTIEGQKIALFNVEGTYYAIGDTCTHRGGPLSEGDVQGTKVTCPWHGAHFDLKTGVVLGPPAQKDVPSYKVMVEGDDIKVEI
jgi:nitrite reductase/ring-hydroxylating ferredoxin subunit